MGHRWFPWKMCCHIYSWKGTRSCRGERSGAPLKQYIWYNILLEIAIMLYKSNRQNLLSSYCDWIFQLPENFPVLVKLHRHAIAPCEVNHVPNCTNRCLPGAANFIWVVPPSIAHTCKYNLIPLAQHRTFTRKFPKFSELTQLPYNNTSPRMHTTTFSVILLSWFFPIEHWNR